MKSNKILHLVVTEYWFNKIESGEKTNDYRVIKPYWISRLVKKDSERSTSSLANIFREYDLVKIKIGYNKKSRNLLRKFGGISIVSYGDLGNFLQFKIKLEELK